MLQEDRQYLAKTKMSELAEQVYTRSVLACVRNTSLLSQACSQMWYLTAWWSKALRRQHCMQENYTHLFNSAISKAVQGRPRVISEILLMAGLMKARQVVTPDRTPTAALNRLLNGFVGGREKNSFLKKCF